jgi:hypothetical protein
LVKFLANLDLAGVTLAKGLDRMSQGGESARHPRQDGGTARLYGGFVYAANLQTVLANVAKLKCDMYDNALLPVALVNKVVSLADHPSSKILQKLAIESRGG